MLALVEYLGEVKVTPLGEDHAFPHISTILGGILAVYHKHNQTPIQPRVDMLNLAASLNLEIAYGILDRKLIVLIKADKPLEVALKSRSIIFGGRGGKVYLSKTTFFANENNFNKKIKSLGVVSWLKWQALCSKKDSQIPEILSPSCNDKGESLTLEAQFKRAGKEICLVSQIQLDNNYYETPIQGIYASFDFNKNPFFINYKKIRSKFLTEMLTYGKELDIKLKTLTEGNEDADYEIY